MKDRLKMIAGDPDPFIGDGELEDDLPRASLADPDIDADRSTFGELHRVSDKIDEDLVQPMRVALNPFGNSRVDSDGKRYVVAGHPIAKQPQDVVQHVGKPVVDMFDLKFTGLYF